MWILQLPAKPPDPALQAGVAAHAEEPVLPEYALSGLHSGSLPVPAPGGRTSQLLGWICTALLLLVTPVAAAHESRPAYLDIRENGSGVLDINWTRPAINARALAIHPVFPAKCRADGVDDVYQMQGLVHERWRLDCGGKGVSGETVTMAGLGNTISDVLLRFQGPDGSARMMVLDGSEAAFIFPSKPGPITNITPYYFKLGVKHILTGADHLLFVLGLLLLIQGIWSLLKTITAFTLAHSISLVAAIFGYVHVPSAPVEAVIALSIMFLACELVRASPRSLSRRLPWLIAAIFGLVHGLGFAGALAEIGLPQGDIPLALFMFNIGIEAGQLMFVIFASAVLQLFHKLVPDKFDKITLSGSYAIGSIAAFWLVERISRFY